MNYRCEKVENFKNAMRQKKLIIFQYLSMIPTSFTEVEYKTTTWTIMVRKDIAETWYEVKHCSEESDKLSENYTFSGKALKQERKQSLSNGNELEGSREKLVGGSKVWRKN